MSAYVGSSKNLKDLKDLADDRPPGIPKSIPHIKVIPARFKSDAEPRTAKSTTYIKVNNAQRQQNLLERNLPDALEARKVFFLEVGLLSLYESADGWSRCPRISLSNVTSPPERGGHVGLL